MSQARPKLLVLSHNTVFHSQHSENIQSKLVQIINKGYDKPRYKYNVIKTARIKYSLGLDLEIEDKKGTFLGICLHPTLGWTKNDGMYTSSDIDCEYIDDNSFDITDDMFKQVIGSVGVKPHGTDGMELTALTSFYPKIGPALVSAIETYIESMIPACRKLYAHVITDHELVPFYEKLGFKVMETMLIEIDPQTGRMVGNLLEDGIELSRSFELAWMEKLLR